MILAELDFNGLPPPPNEPVPDGVLLSFAAEGAAE
jgi:hypothetical protein